MLKLEVRVARRDLAAYAELTDGLRRIATGSAAASVARPLAARKGNPSCDWRRPWGDAPLGVYALVARTGTPPDAEIEYGATLLAFEPKSGPALDAEAYGRLALLAYAGPPGRDGRPRSTQGGLRLPEAMMALIARRLGNGLDLELRLVEDAPIPWWRFWRRAPQLEPLSSDPLRLTESPLDEASLLEALLRRAVRRPRTGMTGDTDRDRWNDRDSSTGSSSDREAPFTGKGGGFAGAGASGGWDSGSGKGALPPGVDSSGRIVAGVAAGALAGAVAAAAADGAPAPGEPGTGTDSSGEGASGTQTETAY